MFRCKKTKKYLSLTFIVILIIGLLNGCTPNEKSNAINDNNTKQTEVALKDLKGTEVNVLPPDKLKTIVITSWKGAFSSALILGQVDKVKGMSKMSGYPWLTHAFPKIKNIPNHAAFDEVNVEEY